MKGNILGVALLLSSAGAMAGWLEPSESSISEFYPAASFCGMQKSNNTEITDSRIVGGGFEVRKGSKMSCNLPVKPGKYVERIVINYTKYNNDPRQCRVGFVRSTSGGVASNYMALSTYKGQKVWYYENLGSINLSDALKGQNLWIGCDHYVFDQPNAFMRYGTIRVDYTAG
ncbi:hypothetical protein [Agaribacter marinus]|uniref:Uncharacterized protein n=1 Tax=Agaribacter marinus TaxID=1431249 RepID=A0AA37SZ80_9ALTE|nr:hypothetical protein [Agaribacter marinus]GLR71294.1 hypothetical protein GCM10007852_22020 [Agaribacter marinus]